jgi:hypothetical protein
MALSAILINFLWGCLAASALFAGGAIIALIISLLKYYEERT